MTTTPLPRLTELDLTDEWDKTFSPSDKVDHRKVAFVNRFGITLAADLYSPKGAAAPLPGLAVSGPFGAVKEQASGLWAQHLAEKGYLTIAFDPSFTGESGGQPRYVSSPDINTEDFSAAVDFLVQNPDVDNARIGIVGICGWGGIALNAAAGDTRIKATVVDTMYDMSRVAGNGYFDAADTPVARQAGRTQLAAQRDADLAAGAATRAGGVVDPLPEDVPEFVRGYHAYYKTERGYASRSLNSNDGWAITSNLSWANARFLHYIGEIDRPVQIVHGDAAHSFYMGKDAYEVLANGVKPENKEFVVVEGADHCDLYDGGAAGVEDGKIPWDRIEAFLAKNLA